MEDIREFDETDWSLWAGAESFIVTHKEPLIIERDDFTVIGDAGGVQVITDSQKGKFYWLELSVKDLGRNGEPTQTLIRAIMEALPDPLTEAALDDLGFVCYE
jgi:hypothetical protein